MSASSLVGHFRYWPVSAALTGSLAGLNCPLLETQDEWVMHGFSFANYHAELGPDAQSDIYKKFSIELALRGAFREMRSFLITTKGLTEDEAISLISVGVDFGVTQVVDGNWGIHASSRRVSSPAPLQWERSGPPRRGESERSETASEGQFLSLDDERPI